MRMKAIPAIAAGLLIVGANFAFAQMRDHEGHGTMPSQMMSQMQGMQMHGATHSMPDQPQGDQGPSSLAFQGINAKMHQAMATTFTGDADKDFVKGMIPHHQGAVDMAKVVIAFGKDPEVRKLAEAIIKSQDEEIAWMKAWLQKAAP